MADQTPTETKTQAPEDTKSRVRRMTMAQKKMLSASHAHVPYLRLGRTSFGRVIRVIDANTLRVNVPFRQQPFQVVVRLANTCVPQFSSRDQRPTKEEGHDEGEQTHPVDPVSQAAHDAKYATIKKIAGQFVFMKILSQDRRQRYLVEMYRVNQGYPDETKSVNQELLEDGIATPFASYHSSTHHTYSHPVPLPFHPVYSHPVPEVPESHQEALVPGDSYVEEAEAMVSSEVPVSTE